MSFFSSIAISSNNCGLNLLWWKTYFISINIFPLFFKLIDVYFTENMVYQSYCTRLVLYQQLVHQRLLLDRQANYLNFQIQIINQQTDIYIVKMSKKKKNPKVYQLPKHPELVCTYQSSSLVEKHRYPWVRWPELGRYQVKLPLKRV